MQRFISYLLQRRNVLFFFVFSLISTYSLGLELETFSDLFAGALSLTLSLILVVRLRRNWLFSLYYGAVVFCVLCSIPIIHTYQVVSPAMIGAGFYTNFVEATEFLQSLSLASYVSAFGYLIFAVLTFVLVRQTKESATQYNKKSFLFLILWFVGVIFLGKPIVYAFSLQKPLSYALTTNTSFSFSQPLSDTLVYFIYFILVILIFRLVKQTGKDATFILFILWGVMTFGHPIAGYYFRSQPTKVSIIMPVYGTSSLTLDVSNTQLMTLSSFPPLKVFATYFDYVHRFIQDEEKLANARHKNTWEILQSHPKYKNYVVVIGESVRRDYLSLYGYPIPTTPFLDKVNGTFWLNYISSAGSTVEALPRMFVLNDMTQFDYGKSALGLANKAGFDTFWLSNQGHLGKLDTPITLIAKQAKYNYFINRMDFTFVQKSDWQLLAPLKDLLSEKTDKPKLIFVHIMGSHQYFCQRVSEDFGIMPITKQINKEIDCYLTSIKQTDRLLNKIYQDLEQTGESFSLMYFADHGLNHIDKEGDRANLIHGDTYQSNFTVPMMVLSSDDTSRHFIQAYKSGFDFVAQFAEWIGVKVKSLQNHSVNFFDESTPKTIYLIDKSHKFEDMKPDPVILPKEKE